MSETRKKTAFGDAPRGTIFHLNPLPPSEGGDIIFVGVDTPDDPEHFLWSVTARNATADHAFAQEIDAKGVHTPVTLRKNGPHGELVFGRRRLLAIRLANTWRIARGEEPRRLPSIKFQGTDAELLEMMLSENAHREDEDPIERARQAMRLLGFRPKADVARAANVSVATLSHWQKALEASPKVQDACRRRELAMSSAASLSELAFAEQDKQLGELLEQQKVTGRKPTARDVIQRVHPNRILRPPVSDLRKAMDAIKAKEIEDPGAELLLRWILGEVGAQRIKGLIKVLG